MAGNPLTEEQYQQLDTAVTGVIDQMIVGRQLIALANGSPFGFGTQSIKNYILNDMGDAALSMKLTENQDAIGYTSTTLDIPIIHKEFEIDRRDLDSSRQWGTPLDTSNAERAGVKVANLEDELIIKGSGAFNGLYDSAGNDYSTTKDFGTAGNAIAAVKGAMALLLADKIYPPYNLVLNEEQYSEIVAPRAATSDKSELDIVRDMISGRDGNGKAGDVGVGAGQIFVTPTITAGTALLCAKPNTAFADLVVAQDVSIETEILEKSKNLFGRVMEALVPRVKQDVAFCKLSDI
jgi:uncharacterized linocin/CFP29 family protein